MNAAWLVFAIAFGAGLGMAYFGGLWLTIRKLAGTPNPVLLLFPSFLVRTAIVLVGFYLVMDGRWERLLAALLGFVLARTVLIGYLRDVNSEFALNQQNAERTTG